MGACENELVILTLSQPLLGNCSNWSERINVVAVQTCGHSGVSFFKCWRGKPLSTTRTSFKFFKKLSTETLTFLKTWMTTTQKILLTNFW